MMREHNWVMKRDQEDKENWKVHYKAGKDKKEHIAKSFR